MRWAFALIVLSASLLGALAGCSGPGQGSGSKPRVPLDVPEYELTKDEQEKISGIKVRSVAASTDATSEKDLEAVTLDLWANTSTADALEVSFFPDKPMADVSGFGLASVDVETAREVFEEMPAKGADPNEASFQADMQEAMRQSGVYVLSIEDEIDRFTQSACADWDAGDVSTLGTPPPEWNCPGY